MEKLTKFTIAFPSKKNKILQATTKYFLEKMEIKKCVQHEVYDIKGTQALLS